METCFQRRSTLPFRPNGLNRAGVFAGDHSRVVPGLRRKALTYPPLRACRKTDFLDFCSHRRCRAGLKSRTEADLLSIGSGVGDQRKRDAPSRHPGR